MKTEKKNNYHFVIKQINFYNVSKYGLAFIFFLNKIIFGNKILYLSHTKENQLRYNTNFLNYCKEM